MTKSQECVSCGMPMRVTTDHALSDVSRNYCFKCADENGDLKPYEEVLQGFERFLVSTQGLHQDAAHGLAVQMLSKQPAWADRREGP